MTLTSSISDIDRFDEKEKQEAEKEADAEEEVDMWRGVWWHN